VQDSCEEHSLYAKENGKGSKFSKQQQVEPACFPELIFVAGMKH